MNFKKLVRCCLASTLLSGFGCGTTLHPDPGGIAPDSNYATAEFWSGDTLFHGLGHTSVLKGKPYEEVELKIQGYYSGAMRVDSERCNVHEAFHYDKSKLVRITIPGVVTDSCMFDFVVAPLYPNNKDDGGTRVYEYKGQLLVKALESGQDWVGITSKVKAGTDLRVQIPFKSPSARVVFRGCGSNYDKQVTGSQGVLTLKVSEILPTQVPEKRCPLEGFAKSGDELKRISWNIWFYSEKFNPLPVPSIEISGKNVTVKGDSAVGIVSLDGKYVLGSEGKFAFDAQRRHTVRLLTTNARSVLCDWLPETKQWTCLH